MGFYGNITNTSRTQFVFDRIYPNRWTMDQLCSTDNVYPGRYVLVEYDTPLTEDVFKQGFFGVSYLGDKELRVTSINPYSNDAFVIKPTTEVKDKSIVKITKDKLFLDVNKENKFIVLTNKTGGFKESTQEEFLEYWKSEGITEDSLSVKNVYNKTATLAKLVHGKAEVMNESSLKNGAVLVVPPGYSYRQSSGTKFFMATVTEDEITWSEIGTNENDNYFGNSNIDVQKYGVSRGYDSTVWQKVYDSTSERKEKYVMIAELNTVVPTFDITADAPSAVPMAPHFDIDSTNIYYKVHWQPQWGMRTKAASRSYIGPIINSTGEFAASEYVPLTSDTVQYPSDQKTRWHGNFFNTKNQEESETYFVPQELSWKSEDIVENDQELFDAAIYFNKNGFDSEYISYSDDIVDPTAQAYDPLIASSSWDSTENKIGFEPTGLSGHVYNQHFNSLAADPQVDTQEFSVMLPALGNAMAEIWDLVYGGRDTSKDIEASNRRNRDISWENAKDGLGREGLRYVKALTNDHNYEINPKEVETIAGAINSVHDLMGMIIVDPSEEDVTEEDLLKQADENKIYYLHNKFMRKGSVIDSTKEVSYGYKLANKVSADNYFKNYYVDSTHKLIADDAFQSSKEYYVKTLNDSDTYESVSLTAWEPNTYYTKTLTGEYEVDKNRVASKSHTYGTVKPGEAVTLSDVYQPKRFYVKSNNTYSLATETEANESKQYYKIDNKDVQLINGVGYVYVPNRFYYKQVTDDKVDYLLINDSNLEQHVDPETKYISFSLNGESIVPMLLNANNKKVIVQEWVEGQGYVSKEIINAVDIQESDITLIDLYQFDTDSYYLRSNDETSYTKIGDINTVSNIYTNYFSPDNKGSVLLPDFYRIPEDKIVAQKIFYTSNTYWYKTKDGNFIKDRNKNKTPNREYYSDVTFTKKDVTFYTPNEYYIKSNNVYNLASSIDMLDGAQYYKRSDLFVISDENGIYQPGAEWVSAIDEIPGSVHLGKRARKDAFIELEGFSRALNTIHGLILNINKFLEFNNIETRDRSTVAGALNTLNDYIDKFKELSPNKFAIIDSYGRINSADWSTVQSYSDTNWQDSITEKHSKNAEWVEFKLNSQPDKPSFTIKHTFNAGSDTTTTADKNKAGGNGNNAGANGLLKIQTPIVDSMGHVVAKNTETITLPYNYKTLTVANNGGAGVASNTAAVSGDLVADNTLATATFDTNNRWIRLIADADNRKVTISHAEPGTASTIKGDANAKSPSFGETFSVPYIGVDQAGHVSTLTDHTVTIPKSSLTDTEGGTASVLTSLGLTPETGAFTTTHKNVGSLALTGYTALAANSTDIEAILATDSINQAFRKAQTSINYFDSTIKAMGVTNEVQSGEFVSALSQADGKITYTNTAFNPSITVTAGTATAAPKINVTVNTKSGTAQALTTASTGVYGVTKLSDATNSNSTVLAATANAVKTAYDRGSKGITDAAAAYNLANGKMSASQTFAYGAEGENQTIAWLFNKVAELEAEIETLKNPTE